MTRHAARLAAATALLLAPALAAPASAQGLACQPMTDRMAVAGRASPYDSADIHVGGQVARICYGRPSSRGRTMIGGDAVPYGQLWRTGANEPTTLHLPFRAEIAGMRVEPGTYSIYTVPGLDSWLVILNRSTSQWGHENAYTDAVRAQEVGRGMVGAEKLSDPVETLTIHDDARGGASFIILDWENTRVRIPIKAL